MITRNEVVDLLALAATFDRRKAGDLDVTAWHLVAQQHRWTAPAAQRAIVEHYGAGADRQRIEPNAITDRIRSIRRQAANHYELPRIPNDVPDHAYPDWYRAQLAAHVDRALHQWATTGDEPLAQLPAPPAPHLPGQRRIAALTRSAFHTA